MSDEIQVGATFRKKRVGKQIAMVEGRGEIGQRDTILRNSSSNQQNWYPLRRLAPVTFQARLTFQRPIASHRSLHGSRNLL